jgi:hypothetical protein
MSFSAKMKVRRDSVLDELNEQVAGQKQRHCAEDGVGSRIALPGARPNADAFRENLDEDGGQHESCAECDEVFQKSLTQTVRAGLYEHQPAENVGAGCQ